MVLTLEFKKLKRTGYFPAFLCGGLLTSAAPAVQMAVRNEAFTGLTGNPFHILMDANWKMMAQLTILLIVCGCSLMYNAEYADRGDLKMNTLPVSPTALFLGKFGVTLICTTLVLAIQTLSMAFCSVHWFPDRALSLTEVFEEMGCELILLLPSMMLMLAAASAFKNMWISLGAGVILTFLGSMIPARNLALTLVPFASPYQMLHSIAKPDVPFCLAACLAEALLFAVLEIIYLHIRRSLS